RARRRCEWHSRWAIAISTWRSTASGFWCRTIPGWTSCSRGWACATSACAPCSRRSGEPSAMTADPALVTLLQFADGLFPSGGFAHSFGLETYVQDGRVRDRHDLERFVAAHLEGSAGPADAAAAAIAVGSAQRDDLAAWLAPDARLDAMKTVPQVRAARPPMGRQALPLAPRRGRRPM